MRDVFEALESGVRSYCRSFPAVFIKARDSRLWDDRGRAYIDLFAGAGTLNYGHNPEPLKEDLVSYIQDDGITHSLDMHTAAKGAFLEIFDAIILRPRDLRYRLLFPGPTGTNAVEAALKLARKVTGRSNVAAFTDGFHGMSLGSLAATGSAFKRAGAGLPLSGIDRLPFDGFLGPQIDTIQVIERLVMEPSSGFDPPAAFLIETVQGEGGINTASFAWLRSLAQLAERCGSLLIVDDIQAGCGRTGRFFSFEEAGLKPDIVCLSKALSGYGLPFSMVLVRPELDVFAPGEHNGTFRGNNLAFVTARSAIANFWTDDTLSRKIADTSAILGRWLEDTTAELRLGEGAVRGRGLMRGLVMSTGEAAAAVAAATFRRGILIETSGGYGEVVKFLPPLVIEPDLLREGLARVREAACEVIGREAGLASAAE